MLKFIQTADGQYLNMTRMTGFKVEQGDYGTFDIVAFLQLDEGLHRMGSRFVCHRLASKHGSVRVNAAFCSSDIKKEDIDTVLMPSLLQKKH